MDDETKKRFADYERVPLAARPWLLVGDKSTLSFVGKKVWSGEETDFVISRVLRAWWEYSGRKPRSLDRKHMRMSIEGSRIYQACAQQMRLARKAGQTVRSHAQHVEDITGTAPRDASKRDISRARFRVEEEALGDDLQTPVQHPLLRSYAEVALDAVLGASIPNWGGHHAHDIRLSALVAYEDSHELDGRLSVDTVLVRDGEVLGVFEVSRGTLMQEDEYVARRAFKRDRLERAGVPLHECDLPCGPEATDVLQAAACWAVSRFGEGEVPALDEIRRLVVAADANPVFLFDLQQLTPIVREWQTELGSKPLTLDGYSQRRRAAINAGHATGASLPSQATLQRMLGSAESLGEVSGGGRRRGQRLKLLPYQVVRDHARSLGISTCTEYLSHNDTKLPRVSVTT